MLKVFAVLILIIIILIYILLKALNNREVNSKPINCELITYKNIDYVYPKFYENINWIYNYPELNIFLYNKGEDIQLKNNNDNIKVIKLNNVGRDGHTILYHIINNYDNLADITIFGSGCSNLNNVNKLDKIKRTISLVKQTGNSVFICRKINSVHLNYIMNFKLNKYKSTNINNKIHSVNDLELSPIRPFKKWFYNIWDEFKVNWINYRMIFGVSKDHIIQHPKAYYEYLISFLDKSSNPEAGHYVERAITSIFYPYPESCVYYE
jgi:hypothetical protein